MNRKNILGILIVIITLTSGPLFLTLNTLTYAQSDTYITERKTTITISVSKTNGSSPMYVEYECNVENPSSAGGILVYKWDLDGDGEIDYASTESNKASKVYNVKNETTLTPSVTVGFMDGTYKSDKQTINIYPVEPNQWHEIKNIGSTSVAIRKNGTIIVYDETDWIPLTFKTNNVKLSPPQFNSTGTSSRKICYPLMDSVFEVTIKYGIAGKVKFEFEEKKPNGILIAPLDKQVTIPDDHKAGKLGFKVENRPQLLRSAQDSNIDSSMWFNDILDPLFSWRVFTFSFLPMLLSSQQSSTQLVSTGSGPVLGEAGSYDPWQDQGITPYGEYFANNQEYVSTQTGYLSMVQTDLAIPGRGIDLAITRIYAPPSTFEGDEPACAVDYSYQDYPWAPMGNSWSLGFPWIELNNSEPVYIHLSNGQRYEWNESLATGKEYHSGDHFTLYNDTDGNLMLCTKDGLQYNFSSTYQPTTIQDTTGENVITFHYISDKINNITDTIGRNVTFSYNINGLVSSITDGTQTIEYDYSQAPNSGYLLTSVEDPIGRFTNYAYVSDYLVNQTTYPTGGNTRYTYSRFMSSGYTRYRVSGQFKYTSDVSGAASSVTLDSVYNSYEISGPKVDGHIKFFSGSYWNYDDESSLKAGADGTGTYHTYIEWNTTEIPDSSNATKILFKYHAQSNDEDSHIHDMQFIPSVSGAETIYGDSANGTVYANYAGFPGSGANKQIELADSASQDLTSNLNSDWFAIGIQDDVIAQSKIYSEDWEWVDPKPSLHVTYNDTVRAILQENASYTTFNFLGDFYATEECRIKKSDGSVTTKETHILYKDSSIREYSWNGTAASNRVYKQITVFEGLRSNRIEIAKYPGVSDQSLNKTLRYDEWGNLVFQRDFEGHDVYTSYLNTDDSGKFVNAGGNQVNLFSDSFYTQTVVLFIHDRLAGIAQLSNGAGSPVIESYYKYDNDGILTDTKNLLSGSWLSSSYSNDQYGNIVRETDENGHIVYYEYSPTYSYAYLTEIKRLFEGTPDVNLTDTIAYDSLTGYVTYTLDETGNRTDYTRDALGRLTSVTYPSVDGKRVIRSVSYDDTHNVASITDENGNLVKKYYDGLNRLICIERYNGTSSYSMVNYTYGWHGQMVSMTDHAGNQYRYSYDADGALIRTRNPDGSVSKIQLEYDTNTRTFFDEEGRKKELIYDWNNRLVEVREYNDTDCYYATFYEYDETGNLLNVTSGLFYSYKETVANLTPCDDTYIVKSSKTWTGGGATGYIRVREPTYEERAYVKFNLAQISTDSVIINANFSVYRDTVSGNGVGVSLWRVTSSWDEDTLCWNTMPSRSWTGLIQTFYAVGDAGSRKYYNLTDFTTIWANNQSYNHGVELSPYTGGRNYVRILSKEDYRPNYWPWLNITYLGWVQGGSARSTCYTYDQLGRLTRTDYPDDSFELFGYDDVGNMIWKQDRKGVNFTSSYDSLNRLVSVTDEYNTVWSETEYDKEGKVVESSFNGTVVNYSYDAMDRVTEESIDVSGSVYSTSYGYDNCSNVVGMTYPDASEVIFGYDSLNRLASVGNYASITYTVSDIIDTVTYGNGVTSSYTYDNRNRPTDIDIVDGLTSLLDLDYMYDQTGSVTSIYDGTTLEIFGYDLLDRLVLSNGSWGIRYFGYDVVGNRVSLDTKGGVNNVTYSYDSMDQMITATGMGFDWDGNGNLLDRNDGVYKWNYTYDSLNRLKTVTNDSVVSARYTYDAGGRRVRSWDTVDGEVDYVYSGLNIIDEVDGGVHERHFYVGGMHIASNTTGTVEYYHVDHLGSTRLKTDSSGTEVYDSNYEPFGPGYGETGNEDYRYTGKQEDQSGLYYFGARYYDPLVGRFTTRDTVFGELTDPQSQNRYIYCLNNPQKYVDPEGRLPVLPLLIIGGLGGLAVGMCKYALDKAFSHSKPVRNEVLYTAVKSTAIGAVAAVTPFAVQTVTKSLSLSKEVVRGIELGIETTISLGSDLAEYHFDQSFNGEAATLGGYVDTAVSSVMTSTVNYVTQASALGVDQPVGTQTAVEMLETVWNPGRAVSDSILNGPHQFMLWSERNSYLRNMRYESYYRDYTSEYESFEQNR